MLSVALACTVTVCCLLVVYLAAYAHVDQLGINQATMRSKLHQERMDNEILKAEYAALRDPNRIAAFAANLQMVRGAQHVVYIRGLRPAAPVVAPILQADNPATITLPKAVVQVGTVTADSDHAAPGVINGGIDTQANHITTAAD